MPPNCAKIQLTELIEKVEFLAFLLQAMVLHHTLKPRLCYIRTRNCKYLLQSISLNLKHYVMSNVVTDY